MTFQPLRDQTEGQFCEVRGAVALGDDASAPRLRLSPARPMMACPLAAALITWRRQSVEPAAREIFGSSVAQIDHLGVYACRRVNGQSEGRPSAHARAAAIDIAGVRLQNGRRIVVARDWAKDGPERRFLQRIRKDACGLFRTVLSPDYNAAHADHLHLEQDRTRVCG